MASEVAKIIANAPEDYNTLKEIADYIASDKTNAANINNTLSNHGSSITAINTNLNSKVDKVEGKGLSTNDYTDEDKEKLSSIEEGAQKNVAPDWNASEGESGFIKSRTHYVSGARSIPFEGWSKRIDENGNAIYFHTLPSDNYSGCLIREGGWQEENYTFFGTEWKSLFPAVSADIRVNYDSDSGDSVLEIILYRDADPESFLATFINNALFAYGQGDFVVPIAKEFIPNTIARQESVDELREETTALWENLDSGTFPNLTAGDLAGRGESVPASFGFRASGGKSIKDGRAYIKRIKGNSVVWNQLLQNDGESATINGVTITKVGKEWHCSGVATDDVWFLCSNLTDVIVGHKYLYQGCPNGGSTTTYMLWEVSNHLNVDEGKGSISTANVNGISPYIVIRKGVDATGLVYRPILRDLTKMFQAGNEPSTIEEFNARVATLGIEDMYAYNEGQVIHCNTESIKSVGDNAWDEQWRQGYYENGEFIAYEAFVANENLLQVIPNETYYYSAPEGVTMSICYYDNEETYIGEGSVLSNTTFTIPANVSYINFRFGSNYGNTYNHDILISLYHSGWKAQKDDQYQPYWEDTLPLPIIRKYFPQGMKLAGAAHDEIRYNKASGKWEYSKGKIKSVDLGTLNWSEFSEVKGIWLTNDVASLAAHTSYNGKPSNLLCGKYINKEWYSDKGVYQTIDGICIDAYGTMYLGDSSYTDVESFKADMAGVILYYESKVWEWVELDAEDQNFRDYYQVADFGTEMSQSSVPSAAFSADIIYQFNAVDMIREHEAEIKELQDTIKAMQAQLTILINK